MNNDTDQPLNSDIYYCPEHDAVIENVIISNTTKTIKRIK